MAPLTIGRFDSNSDSGSNGPKKSKEIIVGIDLGTTNSLVAISENGKPRVLRDLSGSSLVPSVVHLNSNQSEPLVGSDARKLRITDPTHTAYSVKRFLGRGKKDLDPKFVTSLDTSLSTEQNIVVKLGEKPFSAIELSAEILKSLKKIAESSLRVEVKKAVVTVPAYFNDSQRSETRLAGQLAGLEVVRIVNEPTAAALAYGLDQKKNDVIVVYDLGGGTFDVSILKLHNGIFEVLSTKGDTALGGDDFDNLLVKIIENQVGYKTEDRRWKALLLDLAEKLKIGLSLKESERIEFDFQEKNFGVEVTRSQFEEAVSSLIDKTIAITRAAIEDAQISIEEIGDVVMVGGSTRIPLVQSKVQSLFKKPLNHNLNPDEVVALGAAVQADILSGQNQDMILLDIVPLSLGIETYGGTVSKIISRNTKIPAVAHETFTTYMDGQKNVLIHVLQGERELAVDCRSLAKFDLKDLPPMPAGLPKIQVTFLIDANGILTVKAREINTQKETSVEMKSTYGLSDEKVETLLQESLDHAEQDMNARQLIDTRVEAEGILKAAEKILNEARLLQLNDTDMQKQMGRVRESLRGTDHIAIKTEIEKLEETAKPLAEIVMNQAVQARLKMKNANDVLEAKKE